MSPTLLRLGLIVVSALFMTACSNEIKTTNTSAPAEVVEVRSPERVSQDEFCSLVDKGTDSYLSEGMSYETRDIFGLAYDVVHEDLLGVFQSSRYGDYDRLMADLSFAYPDGSQIDSEALQSVIAWCESER